MCPIVTSVSLARIALSFSTCSLKASFCFGVSCGSFNFPCFLRFSSSSLRSCNSSNCSLYEYTLLSRFIFFTFSSFSLSFLYNKKIMLWVEHIIKIWPNPQNKLPVCQMSHILLHNSHFFSEHPKLKWAKHLRVHI